MDIKLKSMTHRKKLGLWLYFGITIATAIYAGFAIYHYIWSSYSTKNMIDNIFIILVMVFFVLLWRYFIHYPPKTWKDMKVYTIEKIAPEFFLILVAFAAWLWYTVITTYIYDQCLFGIFWMNALPPTYIAMTIFLLFPLSAFSFGILTILLRKILRGDFKKTSLIAHLLEQSKSRTAFENQVKTHNDAFLLLSGTCIVGLIAGCVKFSFYNFTWSLLALLFTLVLAAIFFYTFLKNQVYIDTGRLLEQIHSMCEGELDAPAIEEETSLLYNSSQELHSISANLKQIMEKQLRSDRMRIDLITNVSHDLKTPLTSMVGYVDLLKKETLSSEARDYVDVLSIKQEQLKNIIQDIFELSKSTSGSIHLELEELDLKKLLDQTLADMDDKIQQSGFAIRRVDTPESLMLIGDGKKLYRVLQNLIENALKYSLNGTRIFIETQKNNSQIYVSIKNTSAYEMDFTPEEIIERFARGDKSRNSEGHGLGLAIAESFIHNMGGEFEIEIDGDQFKVVLTFSEKGNLIA